MAGLLDFFGGSTGDPQRDQQISHGLLQAGLSLLASKGNFGNAVGNAGMQGLLGAQQYGQQQFQRQIQQSQLEEIKRKQAMQQLPSQFARTPEQTALAGGGGLTVENAAKLPTAQPSFNYGGYAEALAKYDPAAAIAMKASLQKDETPITVKEGESLLDRKTLQPKFINPKQAGPTEVSRLLSELNALPLNDPRRGTYLDAINKATTHQPPVSIANYGSPVPVQLPDGTTALVQPSNKSGAPPQLMTLPGSNTPLRPAKDPAAPKDLTESQAKATAFLGQMQAASKELSGIGMDMSPLGTQAEAALAGGPMNAVIGQKAQRVRQAQDQWAEAFLRFKTGAASTPAEVKANRETFFPKFGDKPENIAQKARMRQQAESDMAIAAGRGAGQLSKQPAAPSNDDPLGIRGK